MENGTHVTHPERGPGVITDAGPHAGRMPLLVRVSFPGDTDPPHPDGTLCFKANLTEQEAA